MGKLLLEEIQGEFGTVGVGKLLVGNANLESGFTIGSPAEQVIEQRQVICGDRKRAAVGGRARGMRSRRRSRGHFEPGRERLRG
jgi:hypothetical protein